MHPGNTLSPGQTWPIGHPNAFFSTPHSNSVRKNRGDVTGSPNPSLAQSTLNSSMESTPAWFLLIWGGTEELPTAFLRRHLCVGHTWDFINSSLVYVTTSVCHYQGLGLFFFFLFRLFILERGGGTEGERISNRLPTEHRAWPETIPRPQNHDQSQNQESDAQPTEPSRCSRVLGSYAHGLGVHVEGRKEVRVGAQKQLETTYHFLLLLLWIQSLHIN